MPRRRRKWSFVLVGAGVVIAVMIWAAWGRARVKGSTPRERIRSICRLADEKPWGAGDVLAEAATGEADASVRQAALIGLARFVDPKYRALIQRCTGDTSALVRAAAAATLGLYGDEAAADHLGEMLSGDSDPEARIGAVIGLGRNKSSNAIVWLLEAAEKDGNAKVQFQAIRRLYGRLGMRYVGAEPSRVPDWKRQVAFVVEYVKEYPQVQEAFREASRPLVRHAGHRYVSECERARQGGADTDRRD